MKGVGMERHRRTGRTHPGVGCGTQPAVEPVGGKRRAPSSRWGDKRRAP